MNLSLISSVCVYEQCNLNSTRVYTVHMLCDLYDESEAYSTEYYFVIVIGNLRYPSRCLSRVACNDRS